MPFWSFLTPSKTVTISGFLWHARARPSNVTDFPDLPEKSVTVDDFVCGTCARPETVTVFPEPRRKAVTVSGLKWVIHSSQRRHMFLAKFQNWNFVLQKHVTYLGWVNHTLCIRFVFTTSTVFQPVDVVNTSVMQRVKKHTHFTPLYPYIFGLKMA